MLLVVDDLPHVWGEYQTQVVNIVPFYAFENDLNEILPIDENELKSKSGKNGVTSESEQQNSQKNELKKIDLNKEPFCQTDSQNIKIKKLVENSEIILNQSTITNIQQFDSNSFALKNVEINQSQNSVKIINQNDCNFYFLSHFLNGIHSIYFENESNCVKKV